MMASISAQDQIATLMADIMPEQVLEFKFSDTIQSRIEELIEKKKSLALNFLEQDELEKHLTYDLLIGLAKARSYKQLRNIK